MHYHLLLTDERGEFVDVRTVDTASEADRLARLALTATASWAPTRYPGRSWRRGEIAVYLDRKHSSHRELSILRCLTDAPLDYHCALRALGVPALNLAGAAADEAPDAPAATPPPVAAAPADEAPAAVPLVRAGTRRR